MTPACVQLTRALILAVLLSEAASQAHQVRAEWTFQDSEYVMAFVNVTYEDPASGDVYHQHGEIGKYSSGLVAVSAGRLLHVRARVGNSTVHHGCQTPWDMDLPPSSQPWIALIRRGQCNYNDKVENAARYNASGVVIYDYKPDRRLHRIHLDGEHRDSLVTIFIPKEQGESLGILVDSGVKAHMQITPGRPFTYPMTNLNKTSVLFVSVSFILLMIISLAWLLFYYVQRFRYIHAKDRLAKRLICAARKALNKIPVKTLKNGDDQLSDGECCAVCLEPYLAGETIRILPCSHEFHKPCVDPWLLKNRTCPMCKMDILKYYGLSSGSEESIIHLADSLDIESRRRSSGLEVPVLTSGGRSPNRSISRASLQSMSSMMPSPACVESLHAFGPSPGARGRPRRTSAAVAGRRCIATEPPRRFSAPAPAPARTGGSGQHTALGRCHSSPVPANQQRRDQLSPEPAEFGDLQAGSSGSFQSCHLASGPSVSSSPSAASASSLSGGGAGYHLSDSVSVTPSASSTDVSASGAVGGRRRSRKRNVAVVHMENESRPT